MQVKVYERKKEHDATQLLEAIGPDTDLVKVQSSDYDLPYVEWLDFEDRIVFGKDEILSNPRKVVGIIEMELFFKSKRYNDDVVRPGDIVEFGENKFIKTKDDYLPVEIK